MSPRSSTASGKSSTTSVKSPVKKPAAKATPAKPRAARPAAGKSRPKSVKAGQLTAEQRAHLIAEAAYYKAEKRAFAGGRELGDWIEAEAEIDALLKLRRTKN